MTEFNSAIYICFMLLLLSAAFFRNILFLSKTSFRNIIGVSNNSDLGLNCLQRLSADHEMTKLAGSQERVPSASQIFLRKKSHIVVRFILVS